MPRSRASQLRHLFFRVVLSRALGAKLVVVVWIVVVVERLAVFVDLSGFFEHVDKVVRNGRVDHLRAILLIFLKNRDEGQ